MTMPPAPFEVRTATSDGLRTFLAPLEAAFADEYSDEEFEADRHLFEADRIIAAFEGEAVVGCAGAYSARLTVPGSDIAAAAVTLVGVLPTHRRRGILRMLMRHQLDDIRERGEPVAALWASEGAIYQRFGYGLASYATSFEIDPRRSAFLHPADAGGRLRFVSADEALILFPPIYERANRPIPGSLERSEGWWRWATLRDSAPPRQELGPKALVVLERAGQAVGYAIYRARAGWGDRGPDGRLTVLEVVADDPDAERRLWRWLLDADLMAHVRALRQPLPPPLYHILAEPRRLGLTVSDGLWLRLIDLPGALAARRYRAAGSLILEVVDEPCPWNAGRWRLETAAGVDGDLAATASRTDAEPDVVLDVADLGAAYLGGVRFSELAAAGRIGELRQGALARADRLFSTDRSPWCMTMF
jgi:predicted acetyltransferase